MSKKAIHLNIIDIMIILIILALIAFLGFNIIGGGKIISINQDYEECEVTYDIIISDCISELKNSVNIGDEIFDAESKKSLGQISDVVYNDCYNKYTDPNTGLTAYEKADDKISIQIKVKTTAKIKNNQIYISNLRVLNGDTISFVSKSLSGSGVCSSLTVNNEG